MKEARVKEVCIYQLNPSISPAQIGLALPMMAAAFFLAS